MKLEVSSGGSKHEFFRYIKFSLRYIFNVFKFGGWGPLPALGSRT
jgi:hypothetical protein